MNNKEFCNALRTTHPSRLMSKEAADVIERLTSLVNEYRTRNKTLERRLAELERKAP